MRDKADARSPAERTSVREQAPQYPTRYHAVIHLLGEAVYVEYFGRVGNVTDRTLFEGIVADERRHEAYTHKLLLELAGSETEARAALRRTARWEAWRTWRRAGRALTLRLYTVLMLVLYVLAAPLALLVRLVRPTRTGWRHTVPGGAYEPTPNEIAGNTPDNTPDTDTDTATDTEGPVHRRTG